jgi:hypothetical protein
VGGGGIDADHKIEPSHDFRRLAEVGGAGRLGPQIAPQGKDAGGGGRVQGADGGISMIRAAARDNANPASA